MTVPSQTSRDSQSGNGVTLAFTVPFRILEQTHIRVLLTVAGTTTEQVLTTNYTVSNVGEPSTTVTFLVAPPNGSTITFLRNVPFTQETDYVPNDPFPAESHERALDKLTMQVQQLNEIGGENGRTIKIPAETTGVSTTLPTPVALGLWGWNETATAPRYFTPTEIGTTLAFSNFIADEFLAGAGQTNFTLTADPGNLANLDVSIDGLTQVPGTDYTYSGTTLSFAAAMAGGEIVLARYGTALPTGITDASAVNYTPPSTGVGGSVKSFLDALWSTGANLGAKLIRWIQAGTGATARTVEDRLRETVSVFDFMSAAQIADVRARTALVDVTAAIQAAIDHAETIAGTVDFPPGTYLVSATLTVNVNGVHLQGAGMWNSILTRSGDYGDTVLFTGDDATGVLLTDVGMAGFTIKSTGLTTSGAHIHLNGIARCTVKDIYLLQGFIGFKCNGLTAAYISKVYAVFTNLFGGSATGRAFMDFGTAAATYAHPQSGDVFVTDFNLRGTLANTVTENGIKITSADGIWFQGGHVGNTTGANILLSGTDAAHFIDLVFFSNVMSDASNGFGLRFAGATQIGRNIYFTGCNFKGGGVGTVGISSDATATFRCVQFANCFVTEYTLQGILIQSAGMIGLDFTGMQVRGNSFGNSAVSINASFSNAKQIRIVGGRYGGSNVSPASTGDQTYGLSIGAGCERVLIDSIDASGNQTGDILINGGVVGQVQLSNCIGQSSATVASAATLTLPEIGDVFHVSGTTNISNIQVSRTGRRVTLIFDDVLTVTDGGNKRLASAFATTADDTLSLVFDGTNWYETGRSVN